MPGYSKVRRGGKGAPPPSLPPLLSQVRIEGQEGLMCCCCTEVWAITMAASMFKSKVHFLHLKEQACLHELFFWPMGSFTLLIFKTASCKDRALTP